ncbi:MAG TPA: adenylate/guanylate cyclase domain-containing protein [Nocardioides sp.]|nr:adenylate/guanylate cyclase domain-containing protein [Nocardioides sp.]
MPRRRFSVRRSPFGSWLLGPRDQSPRQLRIRVQLLLTILIVATNLIAGVLSLVVNLWAVPSPPLTHDAGVAIAIATPTYVALAFVIGLLVGTRWSLHALRWATTPSGEAPADERLRTLRVPLVITLLQFGLWLGAVGVFTVLALVIQPDRAVSAAVSILVGGIVAAGVTYLFCEFALRPVAARALTDLRVQDRLRGAGVGSRMLIFWAVGTAAPVAGLFIAALLALTGDDATIEQLSIVTMVVCTIVLVFGFGLTALNARSVRAPIRAVRDALREVEEGNYDVDVVVYDGTELGLLQAGFNDMVSGLREREKIRDLFGRHVGHEVAEAATALQTGEISLMGETRVASVLFVDLVGSTGYAATRPPDEVVSVLNRFFAVVVDEVDRHEGLVNKFIGDAVLAIFGAPVRHRCHAGAALAAARAMAARLEVEVPEIGAGIGVATGQVVAGNVGHEQRFEYTVIGDAVNSASRLTELAKDRSGRVLATWDSVEAARAGGPEGAAEADHWREEGSTLLRGRSTETRLAVPSV